MNFARRRSHRAGALLLITFLVTAVAAGSAAASRAVPDAATEGTLSWRPCGGADSTKQCASLTVPVDPDDPDGATTKVAVARIPARTRPAPRGALIVNPGGPGVSGVAQLDALAESFPTAVRDQFDVVSFDSRGAGATMSIDCVDSLDPLFDTALAPTTEAERAEMVAAARTVADGCGERSGDRLSQVSTVNTAHDLDALRAALGQKTLTYLGYSYGTYLGALYAALFPTRVRALVLDGAVDPTLDATESSVLQARGFEQSLDAFLRACAADHSCSFHRDGQPARAYDRLRRRIDRAPLPVPDTGGRALNATRFDEAVLDLLYGGKATWGELADTLDATDDGDGAAMLAIADDFLGRRSGGRDDGSLEAFWAISCLDGPTAGDAAQMREIEDEARRVAPRVGAAVVNFSIPCAVWPVAASTPPPSIAGVAPGALVVGTSGDPSTPLVSARKLATELGGASLVIARGNRHTAFASGNACVDAAVVSYLEKPRSARAATRC